MAARWLVDRPHGARRSLLERLADSLRPDRARLHARAGLVDGAPLGRRARERRLTLALGRPAGQARREGLPAEERRGAVRDQPARARGHQPRADRADRRADAPRGASVCRAWPTRSSPSATTTQPHRRTSAGSTSSWSPVERAHASPVRRSWTRSRTQILPRFAADDLRTSVVAGGRDLRRRLHQHGGAHSTSAAPISSKLGEYSQRITAALEQDPGRGRRRHAPSSLGKPELSVTLDRAKAADLGVQVADVASTLQTAGRRARRSRPTTRAASSTRCTRAPTPSWRTSSRRRAPDHRAVDQARRRAASTTSPRSRKPRGPRRSTGSAGSGRSRSPRTCAPATRSRRRSRRSNARSKA